MLNDEKLKEQADKIIAYGVKKEIKRLSGKYKPRWAKAMLSNSLHKNSANKTAISSCHKPNGSKAMQ